MRGLRGILPSHSPTRVTPPRIFSHFGLDGYHDGSHWAERLLPHTYHQPYLIHAGEEEGQEFYYFCSRYNNIYFF
jgi:hypothetical protein